MTRNTKMKLAALATTLVATLGVVAVAPASGADLAARPASQERPLLLLSDLRAHSRFRYCCTLARTLARDRSPVEAAALR